MIFSVDTFTDLLLVLIIPLTAASAIIKYKAGRLSAFVARLYIFLVFSMAAFSTLGVIFLDNSTRIFLLRCGWFALVFDEVVTWAKQEGWPQRLRDKIGPHN